MAVVDALNVVITNITENFKFSKNYVEFLGSRDFTQILSFADIVNVSMTCKVLQTRVKNIKYMYFSINELDYMVFKSIRRHGSMLLYLEVNVQIIRRFLELFGYTYTRYYGYHVFDIVQRSYILKGVDYDFTPLHFACFHNRLSAIEIIKYDPTSLELADSYGEIALKIAVLYSSRVTKYIVENYKAYMNVIIDGLSVIELAYISGRIETVELLLKNGVTCSSRRFTEICLREIYIPCVMFLIKNPEYIDTDVKNPYGEGIIDIINKCIRSDCYTEKFKVFLQNCGKK